MSTSQYNDACLAKASSCLAKCMGDNKVYYTHRYEICVVISYHMLINILMLEDLQPCHFEKGTTHSFSYTVQLSDNQNKAQYFSDFKCLCVSIQTLGIHVQSFQKKIELLFSRDHLTVVSSCFLMRWLPGPQPIKIKEKNMQGLIRLDDSEVKKRMLIDMVQHLPVKRLLALLC